MQVFQTYSILDVKAGERGDRQPDHVLRHTATTLKHTVDHR